MHKSISKMEVEDLKFSTEKELPKYAHSAIICGQIGCGKKEFVLDLLESEYAGIFANIVMLCPTTEWNKAFKNTRWIADVRQPKDKNITIVNSITLDGKRCFKNCCVCFLKSMLAVPPCTSSMTILPQKNF